MSHHRHYTLLPSSSRLRDDPDDPDPMGNPDEHETCGYAVEDLAGRSAVEAKTTLINRALEETGMGRYQWCMYVPFYLSWLG